MPLFAFKDYRVQDGHPHDSTSQAAALSMAAAGLPLRQCPHCRSSVHVRVLGSVLVIRCSNAVTGKCGRHLAVKLCGAREWHTVGGVGEPCS